ncbi:arylsulfatase A-like enzyme [Dysgonomonas hofstadii]|uniref:Arylsulfatase A-like enzyme n=1 Tax=Dysgonomonas hofstadii TaxID=637886 RepID=A0A840CS88_9BACT|nr:sulfatase [Dysgonomonas hofstadii]MBB4037901.1 arylsulfatase A-like enzyme [Dysgonomonas hofstadii]
MKNLNKLSLLVIPASLLYNCTDKKEQQTDHPNIVYIMTDDHAFQAISAYGHPISKLAPTPNIDRLAEKGILFEQAFVENSLSAPSRACLMTGLYSHQNGQRRLGAGIDTSKTFFTELLQQNNYQTAVVGKWHMKCEPKGFDYYSVLRDQGEYYNPGFMTKETHGEYVKETGYATNLITNKSIEFLEHRNKSKPFCLLVHHKAPHRNWMPEGKYLNLYEDVEFPKPSTFNDDYSTRCTPAQTQEMSIDKDMALIGDLKVGELRNTPPYNTKWSVSRLDNGLNRMTPEQLEKWNAAYKIRNEAFVKQLPKMSQEELSDWKYQHYLKDYLRCIKSIDDEVGRLIDYLEKEGLMDNTIIVYTSDQGFYMGEHGWFDKRFMYEESFRTPLIMCYPKAIKAGTKSDVLVQNIDYAPTFLSLAGISKPAEMSGTSLEPLFQGEKPKNWRTDLYYHYYDYPAEHKANRHDGVRTERYKLIHFYDKDKDDNYTLNCNELYDLQTDPDELNNLYGQTGYESITTDLQKRLDNYRQKLKVDEY